MNTSKQIIIGLLVSLSMPAVSQSKVIDNDTWNFRVYLNDTPIGTHRFERSIENGINTVTINAEFDVKFLFISVYEYSHINTEVWQQGCLTSLSSRTDDNGDQQFVELVSHSNGYTIKTHNGNTEFGNCLRSFSYWDRKQLKSPQLINAQTGEITAINFTYLGKDQDSKFNHYQLTGEKILIDLWYNDNDQWIALESQLEGGDTLRYQRLESEQ